MTVSSFAGVEDGDVETVAVESEVVADAAAVEEALQGQLAA